jgi:hypothetical protein
MRGPSHVFHFSAIFTGAYTRSDDLTCVRRLRLSGQIRREESPKSYEINDKETIKQ